MRVGVKPSTQQNVQAVRIVHTLKPVNLVIQVFDPVSVFFSINQADLIQTDAAGNPVRGFVLTQGPPIQFLEFVGELFAACNVATNIEVIQWPRKYLI